MVKCDFFCGYCWVGGIVCGNCDLWLWVGKWGRLLGIIGKR